MTTQGGGAERGRCARRAGRRAPGGPGTCALRLGEGGAWNPPEAVARPSAEREPGNPAEHEFGGAGTRSAGPGRCGPGELLDGVRAAAPGLPMPGGDANRPVPANRAVARGAGTDRGPRGRGGARRQRGRGERQRGRGEAAAARSVRPVSPRPGCGRAFAAQYGFRAARFPGPRPGPAGHPFLLSVETGTRFSDKGVRRPPQRSTRRYSGIFARMIFPVSGVQPNGEVAGQTADDGPAETAAFRLGEILRAAVPGKHRTGIGDLDRDGVVPGAQPEVPDPPAVPKCVGHQLGHDQQDGLHGVGRGRGRDRGQEIPRDPARLETAAQIPRPSCVPLSHPLRPGGPLPVPCLSPVSAGCCRRKQPDPRMCGVFPLPTGYRALREYPPPSNGPPCERSNGCRVSYPGPSSSCIIRREERGRGKVRPLRETAGDLFRDGSSAGADRSRRGLPGETAAGPARSGSRAGRQHVRSLVQKRHWRVRGTGG